MVSVHIETSIQTYKVWCSNKKEKKKGFLCIFCSWNDKIDWGFCRSQKSNLTCNVISHDCIYHQIFIFFLNFFLLFLFLFFLEVWQPAGGSFNVFLCVRSFLFYLLSRDLNVLFWCQVPTHLLLHLSLWILSLSLFNYMLYISMCRVCASFHQVNELQIQSVVCTEAFFHLMDFCTFQVLS